MEPTLLLLLFHPLQMQMGVEPTERSRGRLNVLSALSVFLMS